jgi:hypothetical protein
MSMMNTILWDTVPYSPVEINRRFGGICYHILGVGQ